MIQDIERGRQAPTNELLGLIKDHFGVELRTFGDAVPISEIKPYSLEVREPTPPTMSLRESDPRLEKFAVRYRNATALVEEVLNESTIKPVQLLKEALRIVAFAGLSQENIALLVSGIEQQIKESRE